MGQTTIEWTSTYLPDGTVLPGYTFNPWIGCAKVSPGCKNCYAENLMDTRYKRVVWGVHGTRSKTAPANWAKVRAWDRAAKAAGVRHRVFCASLADVFEDRPELVEWRADLFELIDATPNLDWLLLTKRPENIVAMWRIKKTLQHVNNGVFDALRRRDNVWLGTSVEDQAAADARIPHLLKAAHLCRFTFLSCEPLLGPVDLKRYMTNSYVRCTSCDATFHATEEARVAGHAADVCPRCNAQSCLTGWHPSEHIPINWVIAGGESGKDARPMHPDWARSLRDQCKEAGLAFLFKQWGEYRPGPVVNDPGFIGGAYIDGHGHTAIGAAVSHDFGDGWGTVRVGKHAAGRLLDGVEHNGFPQ